MQMFNLLCRTWLVSALTLYRKTLGKSCSNYAIKANANISRICTGVPSTITLVPTPSAPAVPSNPVTGGQGEAPKPTAPPVKLPITVVTFTRTLASGSTTTQTVTVPQVVFNTITDSAAASGPAASASIPTQAVGLVPALPLTTPPAAAGEVSTPAAAAASTPAPGRPVESTPVAGVTAASSFVPSSTTGYGGSQTGENSPVKTFTGSASRAGFGMAAGVLGLAAFLL